MSKDTKANYDKTVRLVKRAEKAADKFLAEEPKQKACTCMKCLAGYHDPDKCLHCHPAPSLITWGEKMEVLFSQAMDCGRLGHPQHHISSLKNRATHLFNSQISLAVQKERERIIKEINKHKNSKDWFAYFGDDHEASAYEGAIDDTLAIISNKGVEEK